MNWSERRSGNDMDAYDDPAVLVDVLDLRGAIPFGQV
jgi:hypothetical protein